jgi:uncharacterized protein
MPFNLLEAVISKVFTAGLPAKQLSVIWHAGEPLVVSPSYYETAFAILAHHGSDDIHVTHHFQTNATLIDDQWCALFQRDNVRIGVSIDGPEWLHDLHRKTRAGVGTHRTVMQGIETLRINHIPFHAICVLTKDSLDHADEIFDFFVQLEPQMLCFNVEEIEGVNVQSSLGSAPLEGKFRAFFEHIICRFRQTSPKFRIREIDDVLMALRHPEFGNANSNTQNKPYSIVSIAYDGSFSTFSPELLGLSHPAYADLAFGNVLRDDFIAATRGVVFRSVWADIQQGIENCKNSCKYFSFCRGGAPVNKLAELGTFKGTETMFCRLTQKAVIDCVLTALHQDLQSSKATTWFAPPWANPETSSSKTMERKNRAA